MGLSFKKSCIAFVTVAALLFVDACETAYVICSRNDPFQDEYLSNGKLIGFSKDHLINATINTSLLPSSAAATSDYENGDLDWRSRGGEYYDCSKENTIYISQGQTEALPNGIPTYTVQIQNICISATISDLHLSCGWFSSARLINPNVFRRVSYDDCLVNNGNPITPAQTISFQYANTYPYPLSVSHLSCYYTS